MLCCPFTACVIILMEEKMEKLMRNQQQQHPAAEMSLIEPSVFDEKRKGKFYCCDLASNKCIAFVQKRNHFIVNTMELDLSSPLST